MHIIGIDIGTTSICGIVIKANSGEILRCKAVNSNAFIKGCADWEKIQSIEKLISIAMDILDEFICEETAAIGITGQMHGIVYTDKNGNAVSPLYTWQDERGNLPYKDTTYAKYLNSFSGYGNITDFYNRQNNLIPKDAVSYCTIQDYLVMKLCTLKKAVIHSSNAASFGLYDIQSNKFNYDVNADIVNDYCIAGTYKNIPVAVAIGDNQASVFSSLADTKDILLNVGTGSQISVISDKIITGDDIETRPYFENKFLTVGSGLCGGRAYCILKDFYSRIISYVTEISDDKAYEIMDKMLSLKDSTSVNVDTRFAGTRKNPCLLGSITNLSAESFNPSDITLGVINGIINELYEMYKQMNVEKINIVGSGNAIRKNRHFITLAEKKFKTKMKIPCHTEEAAFGASLFGAISSGVFKDANQAQKLIKYM